MFRDSDYEMIKYYPERDVSHRFHWLWAALIFALTALFFNKTVAIICLILMCVCAFISIITEPKIIPEQCFVRFKRELTPEEWRKLNKYYYVTHDSTHDVLICTKKEA